LCRADVFDRRVRDVTNARREIEEGLPDRGTRARELAVTLAGGSIIFGSFLIIYFAAVAHGLYSRSGSGIAQRPYRDAYGDAPGAEIPSTLGRDTARRVTRGTR
jgi:hypothetical protein